jgi:hypothetical protein
LSWVLVLRGPGDLILEPLVRPLWPGLRTAWQFAGSRGGMALIRGW